MNSSGNKFNFKVNASGMLACLTRFYSHKCLVGLSVLKSKGIVFPVDAGRWEKAAQAGWGKLLVGAFQSHTPWKEWRVTGARAFCAGPLRNYSFCLETVLKGRNNCPSVGIPWKVFMSQ